MFMRSFAHLASIITCPLVLLAGGVPDQVQTAPPAFTLRLEPHHPWRPPFGLDRVGHSQDVVATAAGRPPEGSYVLLIVADGAEVHREPLTWPKEPPYTVAWSLDGRGDEAWLLVLPPRSGRHNDLVQLKLERARLEADAVATSAPRINPVDLGAILVPNSWLLLGPGQESTVEVAAFDRGGRPDAKLTAWFESAPGQVASGPLSLAPGKVERSRLPLPAVKSSAERDALHVALADGRGAELWSKTIPVMRVKEPPVWPRFGASYTKLRYDAPISVRDPASGRFSSLRYEDGWSPELRDVVVSLPDGGRYVFWRGSSYIPFWATDHNTGACYEWAEVISRLPGAVDCVEPLMDKELRYGRVQIVESTQACVRVRWTYQSTDLNYKVWGDSAAEEYTFYPDGFGVRALRLRAGLESRYELSEFIILTPQATYPFSVLPEVLTEAIGQDGKRTAFRFPFEPQHDPRKSIKTPAVYRLRTHKDEPKAAVYFNPLESQPPKIVFGAFHDQGQLVTPCYWGSHWPLARGNATGSKIDDRVTLSPCHNSVMSWVDASPTPVRSGEFTTIDALGRSRTMTDRQWAWLIGQTDASDARLVQWAQSFANPPTLNLEGSSLASEPYVPERRAIRLRAANRSIAIHLRPQPVCVNPVFELEGAPPGPLKVRIDGAGLDSKRFAWDGRRLWIDATLEKPARLDLEFAGDASKPENRPSSP
jgi:hypothetical protein